MAETINPDIGKRITEVVKGSLPELDLTPPVGEHAELEALDRILSNKALPVGYRAEQRLRKEFIRRKHRLITDEQLSGRLAHVLVEVGSTDNEGEEGLNYLTAEVELPGSSVKAPRFLLLRDQYYLEFGIEPLKPSPRKY